MKLDQLYNLYFVTLNNNVEKILNKTYSNWKLKTVETLLVIVITFYSPNCLGQETAKGPFGLRFKLPPV